MYKDYNINKKVTLAYMISTKIGKTYVSFLVTFILLLTEDLEKAMHEYISYYNNQRITTKLKGLTPIKYRHQSINNVILN